MAGRDHLGAGQPGPNTGMMPTAGGPAQQHQPHHGGVQPATSRAVTGRPGFDATGGGHDSFGATGVGVGGVGRGGGQQRTSRRDQLARPDLDPTFDRSPNRPSAASGVAGGGQYAAPPARGSPAGVGRRPPGAGAGTGRGGGLSKSYATSPSGQYPDEFRNVPQSISASAFNVGGVYNKDVYDPNMDRTMGDPRMDRGLDRGMSSGLDRGMSSGLDRGMDHHRSTSMPAGPGMHGRSRSASRGLPGNRGPGYHSLDREGYNDRDFMPLREPRDRSLDRDWTVSGGGAGAYGVGPYGRRDRSLDRRDPMLDMDDPMGYGRDPMMPGRRPGLSPNPVPTTLGRGGVGNVEPFMAELQHTNSELQRELANLKKELEVTNQKLGSSMHSIKTFWSPELKKERALRKEESAKYSLINDQLKLLNSENQVIITIFIVATTSISVFQQFIKFEHYSLHFY